MKSQFKTFFRLGLDQRPISLHSKLKEIYKVNPYVRKLKYVLKISFALSFLFYIKSGTQLPGQTYLRLFEIHLREKQSSQSKAIFLDWKISFLKSHQMLTQARLTHEILSLVIHLDNQKQDRSNNHIVETLTIVSKSILSECQDKECYNQLTNLIDIIALRYDQNVVVPREDTDHYQYNKTVMGSFAILCCFVLQKNDSDGRIIYKSLSRILQSQFGQVIAEKFIENGLPMLMRDLGTSDYKDLVLETSCELVRQEPTICVQLLKIGLVSNLLLSTLQTNRELEPIIQQFIKLAVDSQFRKVLLKESQDFKQEKNRLKKLSEDLKVQMSQETRKLLCEFLKIN